MLDNLHTLREIESGEQMTPRNMEYYYSLYRALRTRGQHELVSVSLARSLSTLEQRCPELRRHLLLDPANVRNHDRREAPPQVLNDLAMRASVSFSLHLSKNLLKAGKRAVEIELAGHRLDFPNEGIRKKMANFIVKRILNIITFIPDGATDQMVDIGNAWILDGWDIHPPEGQPSPEQVPTSSSHP